MKEKEQFETDENCEGIGFRLLPISFPPVLGFISVYLCSSVAKEGF
jgi:hypothetical protein